MSEEQSAFGVLLDILASEAQRYQALRARIGDTAIGALMAGESAVVPMACSTGLIHSVDYHDDTASPIPIPSFRAFHIDKIRLDHPAEEPSK